MKIKSKDTTNVKFSQNKFNLKSNKSQSAMETLMTSGWTMLIIALVFAALIFFGIFNLEKYLPDKVDITERTMLIIPSGSNRFLVKNVGGSTFYDLWFNFTSKKCLKTSSYNVRPDDIVEYIILCKDMPQGVERFKSQFTAHYKTKKTGIILNQSATGLYYVTGNYFSSDNLIGYWNMDKIYTTASESYIQDVSWNGNKALIPDKNNGHIGLNGPINNPKEVKGRLNNALEFSNNDQLDIEDNDDLDMGQVNNKAMSISIWFKNNPANTLQSQSISPILVKTGTMSSETTDYAISNSSGFLKFETGSNADACSSIRKSISMSNGWHHVVGIIKSNGKNTGQKELYLDGLLITNCSYSIKSYQNNAPLRIGSTGGSSYYDGTVDEVMIFKRALSTNEITALYESGW